MFIKCVQLIVNEDMFMSLLSSELMRGMTIFCFVRLFLVHHNSVPQHMVASGSTKFSTNNDFFPFLQPTS